MGTQERGHVLSAQTFKGPVGLAFQSVEEVKSLGSGRNCQGWWRWTSKLEHHVQPCLQTSVVCVTVSGPHLSAFVPLVSFLVSVSLFLPSSPSKALSLFPSPPFWPSHSASHTSNPPPAPWLAEDALEGGTGVVRRGLQRALKLEEGTEGLGGNNRTGAPAPVQPGRLRAQWLS